jgi:hypothetical protein
MVLEDLQETFAASAGVSGRQRAMYSHPEIVAQPTAGGHLLSGACGDLGGARLLRLEQSRQPASTVAAGIVLAEYGVSV